jgi:hypothetical protein
MRRCVTLATLALAALADSAGAQAPDRPQPYPIFETPALQRAVERGTRTHTGRPGPAYWQQWTEYRIEAQLDPVRQRLTGRGAVRYFNRSPDTLPVVFLYLYQNLFAPGAPRNEATPVTGGMELVRVASQGQPLVRRAPGDTGAGYAVDATIMRVRPATPVAPGASLDLEFEWAFTVPEDGAPRMGRDSSVYYLAYWYPQLAVYDDLSGWQIDPYLGNGEFYMGYGDYDVAITDGSWRPPATSPTRTRCCRRSCASGSNGPARPTQSSTS